MKKYLIAAVAASIITPAANAATIQSPFFTSSSDNLIGGSQTLSLNRFDSSLGTLTNVFFAIDAGISGQISGPDSQNNAVGVTISRTVTANVGAPGLTSLSASPVSEPGVQKTGTFNSFVEFIGNNEVQSVNLTLPADLSFFTGAGFLSVLTETGPRIEVPPSQIVGNVDGLSNATLAVQYTYETVDEITPIPLPAAAWMLLAGIGALFAFRRRTHA